MVPDKDRAMVNAMIRYGGSFVVALAECLERADAQNYAKLEAAFPEYFYQYRTMAQTSKFGGSKNQNNWRIEMNAEEKARLEKVMKKHGLEAEIHEIIHGKKKVARLRRAHIKMIEEALTNMEIVVIRPIKTNPGKFEFVNQKFVTLAPRYYYEKPGAKRNPLGRIAKRKQPEVQTQGTQGIFEVGAEAGGGAVNHEEN